MKKNFMKSRLFMTLTAFFVMGLIALTGCSKKTQMGTLVPDDAAFVVCADFNSLWDKGDFKNIDKIDMVEKARQELRDEEPKAAEILDDLLKDPNSCGLKLKGDMVVFSSTQLNSPICVGVFVKKAKKFEQFLDKLNDEFDADIDIDKKDGFSMAYLGEAAICWNSKKAYLLAGVSEDDAEEDAQKLMELKKENSMAGNDDFNSLMKEQRDFRVFANIDNCADFIRKMDEWTFREYEIYFDQYKNCCGYLSLNFEKGAIKMESKQTGGDASKNGLRGDFDSKLIDYLPSETFGATTLSFDMDLLIKELGKLDQFDLDEPIDRNGPTMRNILKCFTGDFAANLSNIKTDRYGDVEPVFSFVAGVNNYRTIEKILDGVEQEGNLQYYEGTYNIPGTEFSIKINNDVLLVTNDQKALKSFDRGGLGDGIADVASKAEKGNYFYFDLDPENYPTSALNELLGREAVKALNGVFENIEATTTGNFAGEVTINLQDKSTNSLEYLINYFATLSRFL